MPRAALVCLSALISISAWSIPARGQPVPPEEPAPPPSPPEADAEPPAVTPTPEPTEPEPLPDLKPTPPPRAMPAIAVATPVAPPAPARSPLAAHVGGYIQPQVRFRQNSAAQDDEDGFRVRRARLIASANAGVQGVDLGVQLEGELTPQFELLDAFVTATRALPRGGRVAVDLGQVKAPISRQTLLSDSYLAFPDKAQLASLAPDRQVGTRLTVAAPAAPWIRAIGGIFDGEGRNSENIDENFLFAGRLEVSPIGRDVPLRESAFDGTFITVAASAGRNVRAQRNATGAEVGRAKTYYYGGDVSGAWRGLSGSIEYLEVHQFFENTGETPFHANGLNAQLSYLLPLPGFLREKLEVGLRLEEIDRNDTQPIERAGDEKQSLRYYTGAVSYYHARHFLKVQASFSHIQELEDLDRNLMDARHANDTLLLQVSFRTE